MSYKIYRATNMSKEAEWNSLKEKFNKENDQNAKRLIFHVGTGAGLYSEIFSVLQAILYCHVNKIKFELYSDDAVFASSGWTEYFLPFCPESHNRLDHYLNKRGQGRKPKIITLLYKRMYRIGFLTQDLFLSIISKETQNSIVKWDLFNIDGINVYECAKIANLAFRYNSATREAILHKLDGLHLPLHFASIQIRSGDKYLEFEELLSVETAVRTICESGYDIESIFIFTDDYRNVEEFRTLAPSNWNIFTLTGREEKGYYNESFKKQSKDFIHDNIIKLFAMVECCLNSDIHFGDERTCVNTYIKTVRKCEESLYIPLPM